MTPDEVTSALAAAVSAVSALGLTVDEAVVLQHSNRLVVRLMPCGVVVRIAPTSDQASAAFEVAVAQRLAEADAPVAVLDPRVEPRVYLRDGFCITLWTYYEPVPSEVPPREYASALQRLHAGMRNVDLHAPHFTDRVAEAQQLVDDRLLTPDLPDADRDLLSNTLRTLRRVVVERGAPEQLLHGEPHLGNLLRTKQGLLFTDLQTCCYGPIEFDIAHCSRIDFASDQSLSYVDRDTSSEVSEHYEQADQELVRACWVLMLAMVAAWRWDRLDQFPDGRRMGVEYVSEIRTAMDRYGLDLQR